MKKPHHRRSIRHMLRIFNARRSQAARATVAMIAISLAGPASVSAQYVDLNRFYVGENSLGFWIEGATHIERSGYSISGAGDVNGDGFADIIIGGPQGAHPLDDTPDRGKAHVLFGKASGLGNFELLDIESNATSDGYMITGAYDGDRAGLSVSGAGDFNGDGFDDILIGAPIATVIGDNKFSPGAVYLVFGKASGFSNIYVTGFERGWYPNEGIAILGASDYKLLGWSVSGAGDINADGYDDIVLGQYLLDGPNDDRTASGSSYVIFGKANGFGNIDLDNLRSGAISDGFAIWGGSEKEWAGYSVSGAGDFNGDGFDDIIIGRPRKDASAEMREIAGSSYILFGKADGFTNLDLADVDTTPTTNGLHIVGARSRDISGFNVSGVGDFNGDGYSDVIIGATAADGPLDERAYAGDAYVVLGRPSGPPILDLASLESDATSDGFVIFGEERIYKTGHRVSGIGDVNGDGYADLIVGAIQAGHLVPGRDFSGYSYVIYGHGLASTNLDLANIGGVFDKSYTIRGARQHDDSGSSLSSLGDINSDGITDFAIGAKEADVVRYLNALRMIVFNRGVSYVFWGNTSAIKATYKAFCRPGDAPRRAIGVIGDGSNASSPDSRCWIDFDSGDNGAAGASLQTVSLIRTNSGLLGNLAENSAGVMWEITTDRVGWTTATITLKYTDGEIATVLQDGKDPEADLTIYQAKSKGEPFTELPTIVNTRKNTVSADVNSLSTFVIGNRSGLVVGFEGFNLQ
jgi:hypothetical protein